MNLLTAAFLSLVLGVSPLLTKASLKQTKTVQARSVRSKRLKHSKAWYAAIEVDCRRVRYELERQRMHRELTDPKYRATVPGWNGNVWPVD